jgi:deoxycytidylate deaminase
LSLKKESEGLELWNEDYEKKRIKWNNVNQIMGKLDSLSPSSPCNKLKVAYVLVDSSFNVIEFATNGYEEDGMRCSKFGDDHHCVHAEIRLIEKINKGGFSVENCICIGNYSPCTKCMKELIKIGIKEVIFKEFFHDLNALLIAKKNGIKVIYFSEFRLVEINDDHLEWLYFTESHK